MRGGLGSEDCGRISEGQSWIGAEGYGAVKDHVFERVRTSRLRR